jgi:cell division protein FtsZ
MAEGPNRAVEAAQRAISSPLLEESSIRAAKGVLINITASRSSLRLHEVDAAARIIEEVAGPEDTIFGAVYDETMGERIKITVIATGFNAAPGERTKSAGEISRGAGNVIPLTVSSDAAFRAHGHEAERRAERAADNRVGVLKDDLDEPAFRRRRSD